MRVRSQLGPRCRVRQAKPVQLVRIKVSTGLDYYVEARQRPPGRSSKVDDTNIPIPSGSGRTRGVIVTRAIPDELDKKQQTGWSRCCTIRLTVTTGLRGTFEARFMIDQLERLIEKTDLQERVRYEGQQPHIFNASELAPTSSMWSGSADPR